MALVIRNPYQGLWGFLGFPALRVTNQHGTRQRDDRAWNPRVDVVRSRDGLKYKVDLPGAAPEDVDVTATGRVLTIKGRKTEERSIEKEGYEWSEYSEASFSRSFALPDNVEADRAYGTIDDGVLEVTLPYREPVEPTHIEITSSG